MIEEDLQCSG
jgi:hypothetical protein